jgi:hypothetical protein
MYRHLLFNGSLTNTFCRQPRRPYERVIDVIALDLLQRESPLLHPYEVPDCAANGYSSTDVSRAIGVGTWNELVVTTCHILGCHRRW